MYISNDTEAFYISRLNTRSILRLISFLLLYDIFVYRCQLSPSRVGDQQNTVDYTKIEKGFTIMNEQQPHPILGLNFLQDMKGELDEVTGAYDPEQQLWITQGQVQLDEEALANVTGGQLPQEILISDGERALRGLSGKPDQIPKIGHTNTGTSTSTSKGGTNTGGGRDRDSKYDSDRDYDVN
jgi:hypothetical protein